MEKMQEPDEQNIYKVHKSCRTMFKTHLSRKTSKYGTGIEVEECTREDQDRTAGNENTEEEEERPSPLSRRVKRRLSDVKENICFICDIKDDKDMMSYNEGGLGRCSQDSAKYKLLRCMEDHLKDEKKRYYEAAYRLNLLLSGNVHDIFAADVYYHKLCYTNFARRKPDSDEFMKASLETQSKREELVKDRFIQLIHHKILRDHKAFLLVNLLDDIIDMSEEEGLEESCIKHTTTMKSLLQTRFQDKLSFHKVGRNVMVYASDVNPCIYVAATLIGSGLRDRDLTRAFAKMLRKKVTRNREQLWPISPDELIEQLECRGPFQNIYNVIAWSLHPDRVTNEHGYVVTPSRNESNKIWAISSDWESLLTNERSAKGTALSLTLQRMTGSKLWPWCILFRHRIVKQ